MTIVYLIQSVAHPDRRYVDLTQDLKQSMTDHNSGGITDTASRAPWKCVVAVAFEDAQKAIEFEAFLDSHTGRAFAETHFF
ncbi:MAG: GIY-YIG nuclease family protein [Deltaproteobacteria bacterium]|nr:GIY-YIG nuclease family protein [Deltaproteobacteria bacterium]